MRYVTFPTLIASAGLVFHSAESANAQGQVLDRGSFTVSRGADVIGREEFVLRTGTTSGVGGFTLTVGAHYPAARSSPVMVSTVEFGPDSVPTLARLDLDVGEHPSIFVAMTPRRVTVRTVTPKGESARQFPAVARSMLVDEFMISTYVMIPSESTGDITFINPRSGLRDVAHVDDRGVESVDVRGVERELRHLTLGAGTAARHLWYDEGGGLVMVEDTSNGTVAVRSPPR